MFRRFRASNAGTIVIRTAGAIGLMWLLLCAGAYCLQERLIFRPKPLPPDFVYRFDRPFEERTLRVDGAELALVRFPVPSPRGAVLCFRNKSENLRSAERFAAAFSPYDYEVWVFDYRGYGKSTGHISSEARLHADAAAVYAAVREKFPAERIVLFGTSLGTGLAARCAAAGRPAVLLLEAPYTGIADVAAARFPWLPTLLLKYPLRTEAVFRSGKVACPIHLFHGRRDEIIPYSQAERLAACVAPPAVLHEFPTGTHDDLMSFPQYRQALDEIFARLPTGPATAPEIPTNDASTVP